MAEFHRAHRELAAALGRCEANGPSVLFYRLRENHLREYENDELDAIDLAVQAEFFGSHIGFDLAQAQLQRVIDL